MSEQMRPVSRTEFCRRWFCRCADCDVTAAVA